MQAPRPSLLTSQDGSYAVVFALTLVPLLASLFFVLDTAYLFWTNNRYQNAAELAAKTAADEVCFSCDEADLEEKVKTVIKGCGLDPEDPGIEVEVIPGFYDAYGEYDDDFSEYKDFVAEVDDDFPAGEYFNAVMVTVNGTVKSLSGFYPSRDIAGAAVAYLPRVGIVAGDDLKFEENAKVSVNNGNMYAENEMKLKGYQNKLNPDSVLTATGAGGKIKIYTVSGYQQGPIWKTTYLSAGTKASDDLPEINLIKSHLISLEEFIAKMKNKADKTFTMDDANKGEFWLKYETLNQISCFFDFTEDHDDHEIVFLDLPEKHNGKTVSIYLSPFACGGPAKNDSSLCQGCPDDIAENPDNHDLGCDNNSASGSAMKNFTIVSSTCDIHIPSYKNVSLQTYELGGLYFDQLNVITSGKIEIDRLEFFNLSGVNFYCDEFRTSFSQALNFDSPPGTFLRIITETGSIEFEPNDHQDSDEYSFYLKFGPPCPPIVPPSLGLLIPGN